MPYALERWGKNGAIVVNTRTGKHFSSSPIPVKRAKAQERLLKMKESGKMEYK